jgi:hypothetical protein
MRHRLEDNVGLQLKHYKEQPLRMISDFEKERESTGEYNGRQLLELLQNADDQEATTVSIRLDTSCDILTISNSGNPFVESGFTSLMISNVSSKTKQQFIGNKGLGFRSIVSWADQVEIVSAGLSVKFSEAIAEQVFKNLFAPEQRSQILSSRGMNSDAIPVAFLAIPEIEESELTTWATQIKIRYKREFLDDIRQQLKSLESKILLFLNHIERVEIEVDGAKREISRNSKGREITIAGECWTIYESTAPLPPELQDKTTTEEEYYSIKIALAPELDRGSETLFSFFPTKVDINFPMVVHGTFDLDSSRNQLINTKKNEYILDRLIDLVIETAKTLTGEMVSWKPVRLLRYRSENAVLKSLGFYRKLDAAFQDLAIFPCIDNQYRKRANVCYMGAEFSELVRSTGNVALFPNLLTPDGDADKYEVLNPSVVKVFESRINALSTNLLGHDLSARVKLISILCEKTRRREFELLINDKGELIRADDVYTPVTSTTDPLVIPTFVKIGFLSRELFDQLAIELNIDPKDKARELQRKLKEVTNIQSYEPAQVVRKIIATTNKAIKDDPSKAKSFISEMTVSLYLNFIHLSNAPSIPSELKIQLLNKDGQIADSSSLFLSSSYPSGELAETLFSKVYRGARFLAAPIEFDVALSTESGDDLERFFLWLGVNKYAKYVKKGADQGYINYVFGFISKPPSYRDAWVDAWAIDDADLDLIMKALSHEEIVMWLINDPVAGKRLALENEDLFHYSKSNEYTGSYSHVLSRKPSYTSYQLSKYKAFDDFLILDDPSINFVNPFAFDFDHSLFRECHGKRAIEVVLSNLGAKDSFQDLSFNRICAILKALPSVDPMGLQTQKIYKLALEHFKAHKRALPNSIPVFAKLGTEFAYYPQDQVYYSANIKLPKKIVDEKPLLNLPRRGAVRQIIEFFGIHDLDEIDISIVDSDVLTTLTADFLSNFDRIKPYLLAYRFENLQKDKAREAARLSRLSITLCSKIRCAVDGEEFYLTENDYANEDLHYFIKVDSTQTLDGLKGDSSFCDTFSEIVSTVFTITEYRAAFRHVFKDDSSDVEHVIRSEVGVEALNEARQHLGVSDVYSSFWSAVHQAIGLDDVTKFSKENEQTMLNALGLGGVETGSIDFSNLSTINSIEFLKSIFQAMHISINQFNRFAYYKIDLTELHRSGLSNKFNELFAQFRCSLWQAMKDQDRQTQKQFLNKFAEYEHCSAWIELEASNLRFELTTDYGVLVEKFISETFPGLTLLPSMNFTQFYAVQSAHFDAAELSALTSECRSLLYFESGLSSVRELLADVSARNSPKEAEPAIKVKPLPTTRFATSAATKSSKEHKRKKSAYKHSVKKDLANKESGDAAEVVVFSTLESQFGGEFVEHVSLRDDSLGYDIRYSPDSGVTWKFVEVKRFTSGSFYLTENEKLSAEQHVGAYELFLVTGDNEIFPIFEVNYGDSDRFLVTANEYVVSFSVHLVDDNVLPTDSELALDAVMPLESLESLPEVLNR